MIDTILLGDCLDIIPTLPPVDLIYVDPPFFTQQDWGQFTDKWDDLEVYLKFIKDRLKVCKSVLKDTGSIYVHCDYRVSHYLKVMLDGIFGYQCFLNEIAWCYRGGGVPKNAFARKHDTIFSFVKTHMSSNKHTFNLQYTPYSKDTADLVLAGGMGNKNTPLSERKALVERGGHMPDWWVDINSLQTWSPERLYYPTQKPLTLLERVIKTSSNIKDLVLDPMCGSGTTCVAAKMTGRHHIGIDINPEAVELTEKRLRETREHAGLWFE